jgi:hypothetical protein
MLCNDLGGDVISAPVKVFLDSLPQLAKSPSAIVAFCILAAGWLFIAARTVRNRQMLSKIAALPERDRLAVLQMEMGIPPLREGLTAEEFLRARLHTYYLLAFLSLIAAMTLIVSFRLPEPLPPSPSIDSTVAASREGTGSANLRTHKHCHSGLEIGQTRKYVESQLGPPPFTSSSVKGQTSYEFEDHHLVIVYAGEKVAAYGITALDSLYQNTCIGREAFDQLGSEPAYFNMSSRQYLYVEWIPGNTLSSGLVSQYFFFTNLGNDFGECTLHIVSREDAVQQLSLQSSEYVSERSRCRPNGIGFASHNLEGPEPIEVWIDPVELPL